MRRWWLALACIAAFPLQAASFDATVTHVVDGDSLWVRPARGGPAVELRLVDLDAPEACQLFGPEATRALRRRLLHQRVRVHTRGPDAYRRQLARVEHRGEDIGAWMVRHGHAWSDRYRGRAGPYAALEDSARSARRGLWAREALEPRRFRQRFGPCS